MKGDFARITYDATRHVRRVLRQQGRVELEADSNEQTSAILHYLEAIMRDLAGPYAAPLPEADDGRDGFLVDPVPDGEFDLLVRPGHYWVNGVLCENDGGDLRFSGQPDYPTTKPKAGPYLAYLDVWERHLCADEAPWTVEVALGGPDTSSRSRIVWQVKLWPVPHGAADLTPAAVHKNWPQLQLQWQALNRGRLQARAVAVPGATDPCIMPPDSRYRGPENQLYRVEVHDSSPAATFNWSRDNGTVVYPVDTMTGTQVQLHRLPLDPRRTLQPGDWVEVVDDDVTLLGVPGPMAEVKRVDYDELAVELIPPSAGGAGHALPSYDAKSTNHPYLRRWDQRGAPVPLEENTWLDLEDGVQVRFDAPPAAPNQTGPTYRTGDFWVIPARVATGDVEWPPGPTGPLPLPPRGVTHSYAPLALVRFAADGTATRTADLRRHLIKAWKDA